MQAYETQLEFSGEKGHAVVVEFGKPWRFVFWDRAQYVGCVDVGKGTWFTPEWCETNSPNDLHCYEPIMDKQLRWSRIQILESGPARVRVKWSYALADMRYRVFHGNTRAEEIYTIYPDGVAVREVVLWPGTASNHGGNANFWQQAEWILVNAAGTSPLDVLRQPTPFTMRNGCGESFDIPWPLPPEWFSPLCQYYPQIADFPMFVGKVNLNGMPNPFFVVFNDQALYPHMPCPACKKDHPYMTLFPGKDLINIYKHWPVTKMEDFLEWVPAGEDVGKVATHTSFVDVNYAMRITPRDYVPTPDQGTTFHLLVGATGEATDGSELEELARSYYYPAQIEVKREPGESQERHRGRVLLEGYDYSLRAQTFRKTGEDRVEFTMDPGQQVVVKTTGGQAAKPSPVPQLNPVFLINGWTAPGARVLVDGQPLPPEWFSPLCQYYPQIADFPMFVGKVNLNGVPNPFFAAFNDQVLYPHMPCAHCGGNHPYMTLFPGKDLINVYKHWPVTAMEDFLEWVPAGEDMGKVATHTSFISVNFASRRTPRDYIPTPDPGSSWYFLVGATGADTDGSELEELARSYYYPAQIEVKREPDEPQERHRGRVLLEGYDYSLRAQTFRKTGEDRAEFSMDPRSEEMVLGTKTGRGTSEVVPQINPVFLVNGWTAPGARVLVDGQPLPPERYVTQVSGNDLTVWVEGRFERKTEFVIAA